MLLDTRERVHVLGVLKALGMAPRQTIAMVLTSVTVSGLAAGLIGVPIGIALHHWILPATARAAGTDIPTADLTAYHLSVAGPLILGGLLMATLGALPAATWAARTKTATAAHRVTLVGLPPRVVPPLPGIPRGAGLRPPFGPLASGRPG